MRRLTANPKCVHVLEQHEELPQEVLAHRVELPWLGKAAHGQAITAELVAHATQRMNPLGEREISLRGYKIAAIENTGTLKDG